MIPAAGRGSRLGLNLPKILATIRDDLTVWAILKSKLMECVDHIHVVISPEYIETFEQIVRVDPERARISISVQATPRGMGDAVLGCADVWRSFKSMLVIWGDQVHVSSDTLQRSLALHQSRNETCGHCTFPVVEMRHPYVQYVFSPNNTLMNIRESREGDKTDEVGLTDCGVFVLETHNLTSAWSEYLQIVRPGLATGELNFLPFFTYLVRCGWQFYPMRIEDPNESRGINTPADLAFFREHYRIEGAVEGPH